jgi:hypothetical protein
MGTSKPTTAPPISDRDQYWLDHQSAQQASGLSAREYASNHDVSLQAFYQARKRMRALGLLARADAGAKLIRRRRAVPKPVSFSKVSLSREATGSRFRLELPSGVALEWPGDGIGESLAALLERLARLP